MDGREVLWLVPVLGVVVLFTLPSPLPMSVRPFVDVSRFVETALNPYGGFDDQVVSFPPATDLIEKTYPTFVRAQRRARGAEEAEELLFGECSIQLPNQRRFITALAESRQLRFDPVPELVLCYGQLGVASRDSRCSRRCSRMGTSVARRAAGGSSSASTGSAKTNSQKNRTTGP